MEDQLQTPLAAARLSSAGDVIDALGGTKAVAELLGVGPSSVSNYRRLGFPARSHFALSKLCAERGLNVADAVFGGLGTAAAPATMRAAAALPRSKARDLFEADGCRPVDTPVLQPAAPFIDRMGEEMRRRLYMFTDPAGEQLCLRPDLTIPTARAHLAGGGSGPAAYCYEGMAFRYQSRGAGKPEEFIQAGVERIGGADRDADDAMVLRQILQAVQALGVREMQLKLNHFGMLPLFLGGLGLTPRATARIERAYHQSADFDAAVSAMIGEEERSEKLAALTVNPNGPTVAGRSPADIAARIARLQQDAAEGLTAQQADAVRAYAGLSGSPQAVLQQLAALAPAADFSSFAAYWQTLAAAAGLPASAVLDMRGGRKMAYYTGLSFELAVPALGAQSVIAGGGRYDDLLQSLGAPDAVPAVGGALALERVEAAARLQGSV